MSGLSVFVSIKYSEVCSLLVWNRSHYMRLLVACVLVSEGQLFCGFVQGQHGSGWAMLNINKVRRYFGDPPMGWAMCQETPSHVDLETSTKKHIFTSAAWLRECLAYMRHWRLPLPTAQGATDQWLLCHVLTTEVERILVSDCSGVTRVQRPGGYCSGAQMGTGSLHPGSG